MTALVTSLPCATSCATSPASRSPIGAPYRVTNRPVNRVAPQGITAQALGIFAAKKAAGSYFWLGLAPEGTRKRIPGLRSGFYRTALGADVPLGLVSLDYARREIDVTRFIHLTGDEAADMARIAAAYEGVRGRNPGNAAPLVLLDASVSRADTIVR